MCQVKVGNVKRKLMCNLLFPSRTRLKKRSFQFRQSRTLAIFLKGQEVGTFGIGIGISVLPKVKLTEVPNTEVPNTEVPNDYANYRTIGTESWVGNWRYLIFWAFWFEDLLILWRPFESLLKAFWRPSKFFFVWRLRCFFYRHRSAKRSTYKFPSQSTRYRKQFSLPRPPLKGHFPFLESRVS